MAVGLLGLVGCAGGRPDNLGVQEGRLAPCPSSPNCVASQADDEHHRIAPLAFKGDPEAAFAHLQQVMSRRRDTTIVAQTSSYLLVELRTVLFVDDGEFLLDPINTCIHVRSASRLGYANPGKNRSRLEAIRRQFNGVEGK